MYKDIGSITVQFMSGGSSKGGGGLKGESKVIVQFFGIPGATQGG
jgi:hypothetical protein